MNNNINSKIQDNLNYLKSAYHFNLCSDIVIRNFYILANNIRYKAFIIYIDGMADSMLINNFVVSPLMLRSRANSFDIATEQYNFQSPSTNNGTQHLTKIHDLTSYLFDCLLPQNAVEKIQTFDDTFKAINMGNCVLFVDTLETAFNLDVKGFKQREINTPSNELIVRGSQESFVENLRTNTTILRRLINSEKLVLESLSVRKTYKNTNSSGLYLRHYKSKTY